MRDIPLRQRLKSGPPLLATFCIIPALEVVEMIGLAGFDLVILDMEHGPYGIETLPRLLLAARARGLYVLARVPGNDPAQIGAALDAGADGVLVPQVSSAAAARAAVSAARYAPEGKRGANPWTRAADFASGPEWYARANAGQAILVMIEGAEGVAASSEILSTPGLDAVFLGPVDMSHSLGVPGQAEHPLVQDKMRGVLAEAKQRGVGVAVFSGSAEGGRRWLQAGAGLVAVGEDTVHIANAFKAVVAAVKAG